MTRTPHGEFPEHHTSADDLAFLDPSALAGSVHALAAIVDAVDRDRLLVNLVPKGEPQLGKRGLFRAIGGGNDPATMQMAMLWILNYSDGQKRDRKAAGRNL